MESAAVWKQKKPRIFVIDFASCQKTIEVMTSYRNPDEFRRRIKALVAKLTHYRWLLYLRLKSDTDAPFLWPNEADLNMTVNKIS